MHIKAPRSKKRKTYALTVRMIPEIYRASMELVHRLKCDRRRWSFGMVLNLALKRMIKEFSESSPDQHAALFEEYQRLEEANE